MKISDVKWGLTKLFVFLGPLGNLLTPQLVSHAVRSYFFVLCGFPLLFVRPLQKQAKLVALFIPLFIYLLISIQFGEGDSPYVRWWLWLFQFLFVVGAAPVIDSEERVLKLVGLYLKGYLISLVVGYLFYIGFYTDVISFSLIERFSVLAQVGYGFLRFAPGSYPNEYGIVTSFVLSILTLLLYEPRYYSKKGLYLFYGAAIGALILTTTRAAYLSYLMTILYLSLKRKRRGKFLIVSGVCVTVTALVLRLFGVDIADILVTGFRLSNLTEGSLNDRLIYWKDAFQTFVERPWLGSGFGTRSNLHNVYLQLLFELGVVGMVFVVAALGLAFVERKFWVFRRAALSGEAAFIREVMTIGVIHILWFALSNHNLNHHMTWLVLLLSAASLRKEVRAQ